MLRSRRGFLSRKEGRCGYIDVGLKVNYSAYVAAVDCGARRGAVFRSTILVSIVSIVDKTIFGEVSFYSLVLFACNQNGSATAVSCIHSEHARQSFACNGMVARARCLLDVAEFTVGGLGLTHVDMSWRCSISLSVCFPPPVFVLVVVGSITMILVILCGMV